MLKTLPYVLLLALLGAGVWYFFARPEGDVFDPEEAGFTITDTASIRRIFIAGRDGKRITLERSGPGAPFMLDGKYLALPALARQLLTTLHDQKPVYPVPERMHNAVVKGMASSSVKVEIYNHKGTLMRAFYVGAETPDYNGTYMLMEGAKRPYVIRLAQFEGYLQPRYATSWYDWRDRTVFNVSPDSIRRADVRYAPGDKRQSFTIERTPTGVQVTTTGPTTGEPNSTRAAQYLSFFQNVNSEGFLNGRRGIAENLSQAPKMCDIELTTPSGTQRVAVYWRYIDKRSKNLDESLFDPDRFYALINDGRDTVGIQQQAFDRIFRDGREFFVADTATRK